MLYSQWFVLKIILFLTLRWKSQSRSIKVITLIIEFLVWMGLIQPSITKQNKKASSAINNFSPVSPFSVGGKFRNKYKPY